MKKIFVAVLTTLLFVASCAPGAATTQVVSNQYDYCAVTPSSNLVDQSRAGTPIPPEEVKILTQGNLDQVKTMDFEIVGGEKFSKDRFAVVFVPVGFDGQSIDRTVSDLTKGIKNNFGNVSLDFGYVDRSVPIGINLLEYSANFVNWDEYFAFKDRVDSRVDNAIIVFVINSDKGFASASEYEITISANTRDIDLVVTHEMGHIFGLDDGYNAFKGPENLPNNELWYADEKPEALQNALNNLSETPPVFQVGSCNGKSVYSYYDPDYNIMWSEYGRRSPWGSIFTPVQQEIMNQTIAEMLKK